MLLLTIIHSAKIAERYVVAEGIETAGQAHYLSAIGCEVGQGYYYSRPLPAVEFARWCAQWTPTITSNGDTLNGSRPD
ncbi:EAL domain-containing protein [Halomonas sp. TBZ9]|uniref:EAL domain-containing protein n=1 Tax=Vreelandella azerica TaxID=2732867 RepID=A0A7Y3TXL3_9GAMM|nr:EAL domain-containing protein [Halomonas azerica]NOG31970.1 EAL domain-containing protein [Halomonas azerica]